MEARKETGNGWTTDGRGAQWKAMVRLPKEGSSVDVDEVPGSSRRLVD